MVFQPVKRVLLSRTVTPATPIFLWHMLALMMSRKILTEQRSQLEQSTLCALIGCKLNSSHSCYQLETTDDLIKSAKHATMEYNRAHLLQLTVCYCWI